MIVTPRIFLRLAAIVFVAVLLQAAFFSGVPLLGSVANVVPVVVVALGLLGGAVTGTVSGFAAGILIDVMVGGTLGVSSLALMAAGYAAGRWREGYDIVSSLVPPLLTGALCGVAALAYGAMQLTLGIDATVSPLVVREVVVQALLGALLAVPVFPLIRRVLRPALVDDSARARAKAASARAGFGGRSGPFANIRGDRGHLRGL
ncbi:MAG: rod shape-determining protein MreD [Solirubrobacterales bacterium]|nr:rod shape-determining protein MreD [Solirubrobacterales bacterium]MCB8969736.1 rod shape-determining protein MreD [Thermoleophilales bacterium]MCO5327170.1 rod shape-determining protein MreD [Solirubrobacterales bacterium]